jgi:exodeoxyribonuclease V
MLKFHIADLLRENLDYAPTGSQENLISSLAAYLPVSNEMEVLLVNGYAGTGKTTLIRSLVITLEHFNQAYVLLAPTGRAAKVLTSYTGRPASTIHKKIYRQKTVKDGLGQFVLDRNLRKNTLFIVDEASMISNQNQDKSSFGSGRLLDDLIEYVYSKEGCKLILSGDVAQLPPVGLDVSPALNPEVLKEYNLRVHEAFLDDVIRQSLDSGILTNATNIRRLAGMDGNDWPRLVTDNNQDFSKINGADLIEEISSAYDKVGMSNSIIITRSNKRANQYNAGIRSKILWREEEISAGDMLMVVRNNYYWTLEEEEMDFIANGDIAEITRIKSYEERYGFRFANVNLRFPDYMNFEMDVKIMLDILQLESPSLGFEENRNLYFSILEDYPEVKTKKKKYELMKEHPFYNALQVKFAYAVTCHKAQGGQWDTVFVDQGYINKDMVNREYYRWLYTALTRAEKQCYLVNFGPQFFEDED